MQYVLILTKLHQFTTIIFFLTIVNIQDGYSSYHYVAISNNTTILHHLLASSSGHNVNVPTNYDETPLHLACLNGHLQSAELLCKNGADLKAVDVKGNTVLHFAAASGCVALVNWIAHTEEGKQLIQRANKVRENVTYVSLPKHHYK